MRAGPEEGGGIGASVGVCHGPQRPGLLRAVPGRMGESRDARERVSEVTEALKALKPRRSRPAACRVPAMACACACACALGPSRAGRGGGTLELVALPAHLG